MSGYRYHPPHGHALPSGMRTALWTVALTIANALAILGLLWLMTHF